MSGALQRASLLLFCKRRPACSSMHTYTVKQRQLLAQH